MALAVAGLTSQDAQMVRAAYLAMEPIASFVIVPLSLASLLTGLVQSLGTRWGLFRHYWILNADRLATVVDEVLREHDSEKVILVAHSQGGLVARTYITRHGGAKVAALVAAGTPWLGTARVAQAMTVGWDFGIAGLNAGWGQLLAPTWPAAFAMRPVTNKYFEAYGTGFFQSGPEKKQATLFEREDQMALMRRFNDDLFQRNQRWREDTFDGQNHGVATYLLASVNRIGFADVALDKLDKDNDTLITVSKSFKVKQNCKWVFLECTEVTDESEWTAYGRVGPGDNTIAVPSALAGMLTEHPSAAPPMPACGP